MKKLIVAAGLSILAVAGAGAQANTCPPGTTSTLAGFTIPDRTRASQDACQMAVDIFQVMAPQLGLALAGGNATLGQGSVVGGLGHFSVGLRANLFSGDLPQVQNFPSPSVNGRQQRSLPSKSQLLGLPTADAAIGISSGIPLGLTNVGGIDLLLSAAYVPSFGDSSSDIRVRPKQNLSVGYGVRIGLLQESLIVPGVSLTYLKRDLPTTSISGTSTNINVNINEAKVNTTAWRLVASKSFLFFGLAAGAGQDSYDQSATIQATVKSGVTVPQTSDAITLSQKMTRTNVFLDASFNLPLFRFVGEIGQATGGTASTYNTFTNGAADRSRTYGSLGIRFGL